MTSKTVLIVDDSSTELMNLKAIVESSECKVLTASSGSEAVQIAQAVKPDLIFMDIVMDEMDGYMACRTIGKNPDTNDIPIVFVSSKNQKADHLWAKKQGGKALITKPYTSDQILENIAAYA